MILDWLADIMSGGRLTEYKNALKEAQAETRFQGKRAAMYWVALREIRAMRPWKNETYIETTMAERAAAEIDKP